ncbi:hypothetical protein [Novosphingobium sp. MBES04]|uniref:hypothetical protein n=1 Tax=Novosphingobium sp. MBES04 TaxID=1206458 RepID=UPI0007232D00|nr:hypothetical protein [Novosphingobium sp. MBES04]GAM04389.1 hypothetical conserved protein [Novosphingobium sp. MBES04]
MLSVGLSSTNPAYRRYLRRFIPITFVYVALFALATWVIPDDAPASVLTVGVAILPGLAVLGWIWAMARLLVELQDEYLRMLEVRKFLVATALTLAVCSVWGILELYSPQVPKLPIFFVFPMWCAGLGLGMVVNKLTLGDAGCM